MKSRTKASSRSQVLLGVSVSPDTCVTGNSGSPSHGKSHQSQRLSYNFWHWRRKTLCTRLISLTLTFAVILAHISHTFTHISSHSQASSHSVPHEKRELIKSLLDELSEHELHHIFGKSQTPQDIVPNSMDLISPVIISHRKIKRRKEDTAGVQLQGLGRVFTLSLQPNPHLVHPDAFVHLVRRQNVSEFLPEEHVRDKLSCFFHGHVHHSVQEPNSGPVDPEWDTPHVHSHGTEVKSGRVAVDLCNGVVSAMSIKVTLPELIYELPFPAHMRPMRQRVFKVFIEDTHERSGFIVPSDNDPEHYYVIHPVPVRLREKSRLMMSDVPDNRQPHFLWRQSQSQAQQQQRNEFMTTLKPSFTPEAVTAATNTKGQKDNRRITSGINSPTTTTEAQTATCAHESREHLRYDDDGNDDGDDDTYFETKQTMNSNVEHLNRPRHGDMGRNRAKRSPKPRPSPTSSSSSGYIDDGQFHYKPLSVASDSYWLRYRTTASPSVNNDYRERDREPPSSSVTASDADTWGSNSNGRRRSSSRRRGSGRRQRASSEFFDRQTPSPRLPEVDAGDHEWTKGVLVYESSRIVPSITEPHIPAAGTGSRKYSSVIPSSYPRRGSDSDEDSLLKRSTSTSSWLTGNRRHFNDESGDTVNRYRYGNDSLYQYKSRWTSPSASASTSAFDVSPTPGYRKGRRDDSVFGDKWYTSLDYTSAERLDPMSSAQSIVSVSSEKLAPPSGSSGAINDNSLHHHGYYEKELSHLTIETAVFIDKDLFKHMQANFPEDTHGEVARIVLAMINAVQLLYQDPSLGHRVDFVLKRLEILESDPAGLLRPLDIDQFLTNFCKWQKLENPPNDAHFLHWDHALILTGLDLYVVHQSGKVSNQVVGLAPVSGMCTRSSSCTVNEGRHFESVYVVAHEIGHNLGMRHDGVQADNDCDPTAHIMSPTLGSGKISWSPCSKRYLDMFLETSQSKCLLDKAKSESRLDHESDGRLPGERFNSDKQCVLKYGRGSFHADQQPIEDVCRDLHCRKEHYTWTSHPALEGTFCGKEMWCRGGKCVPKLTNLLLSSTEHTGTGTGGLGSFFGNSDHHPSNNHLDKSETAAYSASRPIEGGWGKWSPFTDCSSACLYTDDGLPNGSTGIRLAARRCDSPRPENGGLQCFGSDRRYKTCTTDKICPFETSKTTVTQYANEVCIRAATVDTELSGRGFMTKTNDPERACSVWCETTQRSGSRSRGWSFPDGTSCSLTSNPDAHTYCIAGKCQDFSCDSSTHFALSDELCASAIAIGGAGTTRHGRISKYDPSGSDYSRTPTVPKTWFHTSVSSSSISASSSVSNGGNGNRDSSDSGSGRFRGGSGSGGSYHNNNHENEIFGWTRWESHSECKLSCLEPAKGLELVQRHCNLGESHCNGVALSVRLCKPNKTTIAANGCTRIQTPFEYATKICSKYSHKISGLSGLGMQLSPTKDDADRPCRIGCQDMELPYRFYMVNGEEGYFPSGTDCSRGEPNIKAFCLSGKCIEFGQDDTPNYRMNAKLLGKLDSGLLRHKRHAPSQNLRHSRRMHAHRQHSASTSDTLDQNSLRELVAQFSQSAGHGMGHHRNTGSMSHHPHPSRNQTFAQNLNPLFDFNRPVEMLPNDNESQPSNLEPELQSLEGSFYEWRKIMSDCSVTCGSGIQEVIVQCISGDTVVSDSLCPFEARPGVSSYVNCMGSQSKCPSLAGNGTYSSSPVVNYALLWNWLESIRLSTSNSSGRVR